LLLEDTPSALDIRVPVQLIVRASTSVNTP